MLINVPYKRQGFRNECGDLIASQDFAWGHFAFSQILGLPILAQCSFVPRLPGLELTEAEASQVIINIALENSCILAFSTGELSWGLK